MSLKSRVARLSRQRRTERCPACRDRHGCLALVTGRQRRDGTFVPDRPPPEPCAACGQIPEEVLVVVEELVDNDGKVIPYDD
jgi:hypothetical protein